MTPTPKDLELAREIACYHKHNLKDGNAAGLEYDILNALSKVRQEENKACAKVATSICEGRIIESIGMEIAQAIRLRNQEGKGDKG